MNWIIGLVVVAGVLALADLMRSRYHSVLEQAERDRTYQNHRVRKVHADAGNVWYPHLMADGSVRWYRVDHAYAVDL